VCFFSFSHSNELHAGEKRANDILLWLEVLFVNDSLVCHTNKFLFFVSNSIYCK